MKKSIIKLMSCTLALASLTACADLDLNPLSEPSSGNWYSNLDEVRLSLNDNYRLYLYAMENEYFVDRRSDDWSQRDYIYDFVGGSMSSQTYWITNLWTNTYKGISRCNRVVNAIESSLREKYPESQVLPLEAEARFFRGLFYARLVTHFGGVPYYTDDLTIDEARQMGRADADEIIDHVYEDLDFAIENLPLENSSSGVWRITKGAAIALKARVALRMGNYTKTAEAAKECMDLGVYSLYEDYGELFRQKGMTCETIFALARSYELGEYQNIKSWVPRTAGGTANAQPSWDLLAAYECTDGLTIDKSPLFNPKNPFENRDPRCTEMFVEPGTTIYGIVYNPSPTAKTVLNTNTGAYVKNKDCKSVDQYASYNSCCLRKGSQSTWNTTLANDNPTIIIRYADVLLMYAEAKIELNQIDQSVLDAINDVRARAYKCKRSETSKYPAITTTNQDELRTVLRRERRVELAWECLRFYDLIRWRWLDKAFSHDGYGHLTAAGLTKQEAAGNFFWPAAPPIDEYGMADFSGWYEQGLIGRYTQRVYDDRLYLWPIPYEEVDISNGKIEQNPGW